VPNRLPHGRQIVLLVLGTAAPGTLGALLLLWHAPIAPWLRWSAGAVLLLAFAAGTALVREHVHRPLLTLSSLLAALREGDFSIQARGARPNDPLGEVMLELNALIGQLREQRLGALDATALLRTVMGEINVAVFAFDERERLRLANRAGERLLAQPVERALGRTARQLGLADCLTGEPDRTIQASFPGGLGRWGLRRTAFRQGGTPHHLLVLADLSQALREEERQAWQRLIRVLGHELNNSLAPIKSISNSLASLLARNPLPEDWREDVERGLRVITSRTDSLTRFLEAYSRLARLPAPRLAPIDVADLARRVAELETRLPIEILTGPPITAEADTAQLEQALINLLRNATDASLETGGGVRITWVRLPKAVEIQILDEGPGLSGSANLFVPFFTTKPGGSGIGLALSRQIVEAHGGSLTLENRPDRAGCLARLRLPLGGP
jgi:two-component system, NtrC family, nitrogen regulation sensor histidine kinase NtrY